MRTIERTLKSEVAPVGTFTVRRALPAHDRRSIGPWVFLDHFGPFRIKPGEDGVGAHPHAGIETVTYILNGRNRHRDSAGNEGVVTKHGAQWMTAGRGIVHAEASLAENEDEMTLHGIQLWTSLPRAKKLMDRNFQRIDAASIAEFAQDGAVVRVVAGEVNGHAGPAHTEMPLFLAHVQLATGAATELRVGDTDEAGVYVISGAPVVNGRQSEAGELVVLDNIPGPISIEASAPAEVMLLGGAPAEGPLVFHGPFVMNSVEQVRFAERAYMTGQMGHLDG